ncbi:hypothetical protein PM082_016433 [Marasmius tenuissimus]|nr:hypothetical protein PM082_016433 [Marasmius tenuissimus]
MGSYLGHCGNKVIGLLGLSRDDLFFLSSQISHIQRYHQHSVSSTLSAEYREPIVRIWNEIDGPSPMNVIRYYAVYLLLPPSHGTYLDARRRNAGAPLKTLYH